MKRLLSASIVFAALLPAARARAATDWASCTTPLATCSSTVTSCCTKTMTSSGGYNAVIIPLDRCHQRVAVSGTDGPPGVGAPDSSGNGWCGDAVGSANAGGSTADDGMYRAYGLAYRLMQKGIPVYWIINPTKDPPALTASQNASSQQYIATDIDFWVVNSNLTSPPAPGNPLTACGAGCTDPVKRLSVSANYAPKDDSYNYTAFPVRGSAFMIAPADRATFDAFIKRTGSYASLAGNSYYDWSQVDMYEMEPNAVIKYQDFTTASPYTSTQGAPVAVEINYTPPHLARQSPAGVSDLWLAKANLKEAAASTCKTGSWSPADAVYCDITVSDIEQGTLVSGAFNWAWIDNWSDNSPCGNSSEQTQVDKVENFMTAVPGVRSGGSVIFMQAVIGVMEGCKGKQIMGVVGNSTGMVGNNQAPAEKLILRNPSSLFMQYGDLAPNFASGSPGSWYYTTAQGSTGYAAQHTGASGTLVRFVTQDGGTTCTNHKSGSVANCDTFASNSSDNLDAMAYIRYNDVAANGVAFYMGGNNVTQNGNASHLRIILDTLLASPAGIVAQEATIREVSRSNPIVATVGNTTAQYQGTFEVVSNGSVTSYTGSASNSTFVFPFYQGHLRAYDTGNLNSTRTDFDSVTAIFDAGASTGMIPDATASGCASHYTSSCRTVFTTTTTPSAAGLVTKPDLVYMETGNEASLQPLLGSSLSATDTNTLISRILAGEPNGSGGYKPKLGGIDRSTMAIIEKSPFIPEVDRPTMIYVGATDGMLHAICAEDKGNCDKAGRELWAYIPRNQLGKLSTNTGRIDGSPKVADVFADFDGDGTSEWKTILTFQTGSGTPGTQSIAPEIVAMDITDPTSPSILWERTTPSTRGSVELGQGLNLAMGPVKSSGAIKNLVFAQTNNGGTDNAGWYLAAYNTTDGSIEWSVTHLYPDPRSGSDAVVPTDGIPGGVAAFDEDQSGFITNIAFGDLYGSVWNYEADGTNPFGTSAIFTYSADYHPIGHSPTVYRDLNTSDLHLAFADGGYVAPVSTTWKDTSLNHWLVGMVPNPAGSVPMDETSATGSDLVFVKPLGTNEKVYSQPEVQGDEIFVTADTDDPNTYAYGTVDNTGALYRFLLDTGAQLGTAAVIAGGASSVEVDSTGYFFVGSSNGVQKINSNSAAGGGGGTFHSEGVAVERDATTATTRLLWMSS